MAWRKPLAQGALQRTVAHATQGSAAMSHRDVPTNMESLASGIEAALKVRQVISMTSMIERRR
jgi:hypothetical protein